MVPTARETCDGGSEVTVYGGLGRARHLGVVDGPSQRGVRQVREAVSQGCAGVRDDGVVGAHLAGHHAEEDIERD